MKINSSSLGICILNKLIKQNIRHNFFGFDGEFSLEELNSIESLVISQCDSLDGLEHLPNLKSLKIVGVNLDSFEFKGLPNNITDYSQINKLASLEELTIWHETNIISLDVSNLQKLKRLNLICNVNLQELKGIEKLEQLEMVCTNGSPIKIIEDPKKYIENTKDTPINILDIRTYNSVFSSNEMFSYLRNKLMSNLSNLKFSEHVYFYDEMYTLSLEQMRELYRLGTTVIRGLKLNALSSEEKALAIYKYVIQNVTYDHEGLNFRDLHYEKYLGPQSESNNYFLRRMSFINSSLNALKNGKAVCDGYVNMMIYLLDLCGIKAESVICKTKEGNLHTALKIHFEGTYIYADPEQDSRLKKICFYGLTLEEMEKIYTLAPKEHLEQLMGENYVKHFN